MKRSRVPLPGFAIALATVCLYLPLVALAAPAPPPEDVASPPNATPGADAGATQAMTDGEARATDGTSSQWEDLDLKGLVWDDNTWLNWSILAGALVLGWLAGRIAASVLRRVAARFDARGLPIRTHVVRDLAGPAKMALVTAGLAVGLAQVTMADPLRVFCTRLVLFLFCIAGFWYAYNLVALIEVVMRRFTAKTELPLDEQLVPMVRKALRAALVVVAAIFVIDSVFEGDVFALVAAIGVVGLPLGFAAQDVLKNMFGSIVILFNRPFQVGERIQYAGYDGVIEEIGFQTTRLRTLTGHVVTVPNSKIASDAVENIGRRPTIRRIMNVTITYDTPKEKIEQGVQILRDILEEEGIREPIHPTINGDEFPPRVFFNDYNADSLNIFVIYWYAPPAWWDYMEHAHRLNLRIFEEFDKAGIEFAFPTQTLYLAGDPKRELAVKMLGETGTVE
jgi:MscS family membrane protein